MTFCLSNKIRESEDFVVNTKVIRVVDVKEFIREIKIVLDKFGHRDKVSALNEIVKVDDNVPGCPMDENKFLELLNKYFKEFKVV